ncbi:MAG: DivIVA domain-containing protein [Oscillospiraceae bacterium]
MNAKDILSRRFEKATFNGYKTDDVDEFLREVSSEYSQLQKDKNELERKLEVLADKIREYRDDEDALKDALLLAQKQGNQIISDAKVAAEKLRTETQEAIDKQLKEAQEKAAKLTSDADEYSKRITKETNERADKMIKEARAKADEIDQMMKKQTEIQQNILQKTRKEADEYRNRLLTAYKSHMELVAKLPEMCENEYVRNTAAEVEKREAEKAKAAAQAPKSVPAPKPAPIEEAPEEKPVEEKQPVAAGAVPTEEPFSSMPQEADNTNEYDDLPFFGSGSEKKTRHTDLQFGKGNTMKK